MVEIKDYIHWHYQLLYHRFIVSRYARVHGASLSTVLVYHKTMIVLCACGIYVTFDLNLVWGPAIIKR